VFAEAKLGSDITPSTTYDPLRNQIVRNIDCVLDQAEDRVPMFWMFVRDTDVHRLYVRVLNQYRNKTEKLVRELPHHDPVRIAALTKNLSFVLWKDVVSKIVHAVRSDNDERTEDLVGELWRRVG
jgi:hypothetical protein